MSRRKSAIVLLFISLAVWIHGNGKPRIARIQAQDRSLQIDYTHSAGFREVQLDAAQSIETVNTMWSGVATNHISSSETNGSFNIQNPVLEARFFRLNLKR